MGFHVSCVSICSVDCCCVLDNERWYEVEAGSRREETTKSGEEEKWTLSISALILSALSNTDYSLREDDRI
jgi:hypothetical protein